MERKRKGRKGCRRKCKGRRRKDRGQRGGGITGREVAAERRGSMGEIAGWD